MKVAIYIEQGDTQLVLTPETEWEKSVTAKLLPDGEHTVRAYRGQFYECQGGWYRHGARGVESLNRIELDETCGVDEIAGYGSYHLEMLDDNSCYLKLGPYAMTLWYDKRKASRRLMVNVMEPSDVAQRVEELRASRASETGGTTP